VLLHRPLLRRAMAAVAWSSAAVPVSRALWEVLKRLAFSERGNTLARVVEETKD